MNDWLVAAVLLIAVSPLLFGADRGSTIESCRSGDLAVNTAPPDFLFATAQEWNRFAMEANLDRLR